MTILTYKGVEIELHEGVYVETVEGRLVIRPVVEPSTHAVTRWVRRQNERRSFPVFEVLDTAAR